MKVKYTQEFLLSSKGIKVNTEGRWFFHRTKFIEDLETLESIITLIESEEEDSIVINLVDNYGRTALHYAAMYGNQNIVTALLIRMTSESIGLMDKENNSALDYANKCHHPDIFKQLLLVTPHGSSLFPLGYEPEFFALCDIEDSYDNDTFDAKTTGEYNELSSE